MITKLKPVLNGACTYKYPSHSALPNGAHNYKCGVSRGNGFQAALPNKLLVLSGADRCLSLGVV